MRPLPLACLLVVLLLGAPALAGCLGEEAAPAPGPDAESPATGTRQPLRLVTDEQEIPLDPWLREDTARGGPSLLRLGQLDHWETVQGAMRLLSDGQSFVLLVDQSAARHGQGTAVFARVFAPDVGTVAAGFWVARGDEGTHVPIALPSHDIIRFGVAYRYEVLVFAPGDAPDCACWIRSAPSEEGLEEGMRIEMPVEPVGDGAAPSNAWNGTIVHRHAGPLSFGPTWELGFEGPSAGTDRPDPLERPLFGGAETGLYTFTFTGQRVWLMDLLFEFDRSRIAGSDPHVRGNGSSSIHVQLDGWQPLEAYTAMAPSKGLEQSFTLRLDIDFETQDDLPGEEDQLFFVTAAIGYRLGGSTYVAEHAGRDLAVRVVHSV